MAFDRKKKSRNLLLLLLLMIILIGASIWLIQYNDKKDSKDSDTIDETSVIATTDTTAIRTIHFETTENEMTLLLSDDGIWLNYLDEKFPVNQTYAQSMASSFASISASRIITEDIEDLSVFGLTKPVATISAMLNDGTTTTLKLGSEVPVTGGYYASLNDDGKVYVIPASFYTTFDYTLVQMTDIEAIPGIVAENITHLLINNAKKPSFEIIYDEDSLADLSGFSNWIISKPYETQVPADGDAITTFLGNYTAMSFSSCVDYNATDLSKYGLDKPTSQIDISYYEEVTQDSNTGDNSDSNSDASDDTAGNEGVTKVNHELILLIGGTDAEGNYYAKLSNSSAVNIITASTVATLTDVDAYSNTYHYVNMINIAMVNSIDIAVEGVTYQLRIDRATETVDGKEQEVATYYINDKKVEEDVFKALYQVIIAPQTEKEIPDKTTNITTQSPYMTVSYHLITRDEPFIIKYLPYDVNYYVVNTDGVQYFLTDLRNITQITDSLKAVK